jgi:hypothetical protein
MRLTARPRRGASGLSSHRFTLPRNLIPPSMHAQHEHHANHAQSRNARHGKPVRPPRCRIVADRHVRLQGACHGSTFCATNDELLQSVDDALQVGRERFVQNRRELSLKVTRYRQLQAVVEVLIREHADLVSFHDDQPSPGECVQAWPQIIILG